MAKIPCKRCGEQATEFLAFTSRYKSAKVDLCDECFHECRRLFEKFLFPKEKEPKRVGN